MKKGKLTIPDIIAMKTSGEKITMLTAYDVSLARMLDSTGIEIVLVGVAHIRAVVDPSDNAVAVAVA